MPNHTSLNLELILAFPKHCNEFRALRFISTHYFLYEKLSIPMLAVEQREALREFRITLSTLHQRAVIYPENLKQTHILSSTINAS